MALNRNLYHPPSRLARKIERLIEEMNSNSLEALYNELRRRYVKHHKSSCPPKYREDILLAAIVATESHPGFVWLSKKTE